MLNFKKVFNAKIIFIALCAVFLFTAPLYALSLRIPVGEKATYDRIARITRVTARIGNSVGPMTYNNVRPLSVKGFVTFVEHSAIFKHVYSKKWESFLEDLENKPESSAYELLLAYFQIKHKTHLYRIQEQHGLIENAVPELLAKKIKSREEGKPVYIRLVTLGGEYDPVSFGATLIEAINIELGRSYPDLQLGRDLILEIQDVQLDPKAIALVRKRLSSASPKEFTLKDMLYSEEGGTASQAPDEVKRHVKAVNKNKDILRQIIRLRQGSIADGELMEDVLKDAPDFVICNNVFYHLDIPHQKGFIDFLAKTASEDTVFVFTFNAGFLNHAADEYVNKFGGDPEIASQVRPTEEKRFPPLFEKYFSLEKVPIRPFFSPDSCFYILRKRYLISEADRNNEEFIKKILMINSKFKVQTGLSKNDFENNVEAVKDGSCGLVSMVDSGTSEIIGYVIYRGLGTRAMYLENIFVRPENRMQGMAGLLLEYCQKAFDYIALDNIPSIFSAKEGMQRLYERMGFYENRDTGSLIWARYRDKDAPRDFLDILERLEQHLVESPNTDI